MVIVSHDIKIETKCRLCMLCGRGENADGFIFRWVNLNTETGVFVRNDVNKFIGYRHLDIIFIVVTC